MFTATNGSTVCRHADRGHCSPRPHPSNPHPHPRGKVISATHRHQEFLQFLHAVDRHVPAGLDVHLICDSYATHNTQAIKHWSVRHPLSAALHADRQLVAEPGGAVGCRVDHPQAAVLGPTAASPGSRLTSLRGRRPGTRTPSRLCGPGPPTRSSTTSQDIFIVLTTQDTSAWIWATAPLIEIQLSISDLPCHVNSAAVQRQQPCPSDSLGFCKHRGSAQSSAASLTLRVGWGRVHLGLQEVRAAARTWMRCPVTPEDEAALAAADEAQLTGCPGEHVDAVPSGPRRLPALRARNHGRLQRSDCLDRAGAVGALADDLDAVLLLEQEAQALADHLVVVDDQHPDHGRPAGSRTRTLVPWPGVESSWRVPPSSATRSRISPRPRPCRSVARAGSKPAPSSVTVTATWPSWWCSRSRIRVGWACLMALASASWTTRSTACSTGGASWTGSRSASTVTPSRSW